MTSSPTHTSPLLQQQTVNSLADAMTTNVSTEEKKKEKLCQSTPVTTSTNVNVSSVNMIFLIFKNKIRKNVYLLIEEDFGIVDDGYKTDSS